jgi:hypothetical protein
VHVQQHGFKVGSGIAGENKAKHNITQCINNRHKEA